MWPLLIRLRDDASLPDPFAVHCRNDLIGFLRSAVGDKSHVAARGVRPGVQVGLDEQSHALDHAMAAEELVDLRLGELRVQVLEHDVAVLTELAMDFLVGLLLLDGCLTLAWEHLPTSDFDLWH